MATCKVLVEVSVDRKIIKTREWPECDILNTLAVAITSNAVGA